MARTAKKSVLPQPDSLQCIIPDPPPGSMVLDIPDWRPATLNELTKRGNHFMASRLKKIDREMIAGYATKYGIPVADRPRRVSLVVTLGPRNRMVDPDALNKSLLDGLVRCKLLVDDSQDWVEIGGLVQVKGIRLSTRIILEDLPIPDGDDYCKRVRGLTAKFNRKARS